MNLIKKVLLACLFTTGLVAQVKGKVLDSNGQAVPFANVLEEGTSNGTTTNTDGSFKLKLRNEFAVLEVSSVGFETVKKKVKKGDIVTITIKEGNVLDEVVITGNRSKPRTVTDSPVPIDNIGVAELQGTGKTSIDQMLNYAIPSYNATNQAISDATAHFDPSDLRGLGPSRTLVLVNGKRKNQSALIYVNDTPGKGEVGTDFKSIPTSAIKSVEVLRDGASAQYGSDAVAGVINVILKENTKFTQVNFDAGITKEGDGLNFGADVNHTFSFGNGGFVNASISGYHQKATNRAGTPGKDVFFGEALNDESLTKGTHSWVQKNPSLGMNIGQPEMTKGNIFLNTSYPLSEKVKLYAFGGYNFRKGKSFALYRAPYWIQDPHNLLHQKGTEYQGFQPTFGTNIQDILATVGSEFELGGFNFDLSATYGSNNVEYIIGNTLNPSLEASSPISFNAGTYNFNNAIANFDVNRTFGKLTLGVGVEARQENFVIKEGQKESYVGKGAQSFPGVQSKNATDEKRTNVGAYLSADLDITDRFLIGGAVRYENFSDFGSNVSWKLNSRYKLNNMLTLRGAYSSGFRAPSLHQIYYSNVVTLVGDNEIIDQGNFRNTDKVVENLGVPKLFAETSRNISLGFALKTSDRLTISLDYYNVKINDRVLYTGQITEVADNGQVNSEIKRILDENKVGAITFFMNTLNTTTQGFDYSMRYNNIKVWKGNLGLNLSLNANYTSLDGDIKVPEKLKDYKTTLFNREEKSRITSARPNLKFMYGAHYKVNNFRVGLNNTYFGSVTWRHKKDSKKDQTFSAKTLTDLDLAYNVSQKITINLNMSNLFDVYPDEIDPKGDSSTNLGGRFKYPWEVNQFGFNGTTFKAGVQFKF